jgi:hypothetical protein
MQRAVTRPMVAAAFWAFKINRTRDTWVGTELNRRIGRETLPRIPSNESRMALGQDPAMVEPTMETKHSQVLEG